MDDIIHGLLAFVAGLGLPQVIDIPWLIKRWIDQRIMAWYGLVAYMKGE